MIQIFEHHGIGIKDQLNEHVMLFGPEQRSKF